MDTVAIGNDRRLLFNSHGLAHAAGRLTDLWKWIESRGLEPAGTLAMLPKIIVYSLSSRIILLVGRNIRAGSQLPRSRRACVSSSHTTPLIPSFNVISRQSVLHSLFLVSSFVSALYKRFGTRFLLSSSVLSFDSFAYWIATTLVDWLMSSGHFYSSKHMRRDYSKVEGIKCRKTYVI